MILQSIKMAWKSICGNKMRSFLTMLGIIIGVIALVVLVSLVNSATTSVTDQISSLGNNLLSATILDTRSNPLRLSELSALLEDPQIELVAPFGQLSATAKSGSESQTATVYGTSASYQQIQGLELESGRFLKTTDLDNSTYIAVLNQNAASELFGSSAEAIGKTLTLNGRSFLVVGVLAEDDSVMSSMMGDSLEVYIPYTVYMRMAQSTSVSSFYATSSDPNDMDKAEAALNSFLLDRFKQDEDAFNIINQSTLLDAMNEITGTLSLLLGGIAAISLLVGGIGIMNIMLVSVTERTREIGIRKAIGAGRSSIMIQFLIEALMVSLMGCLIGIAISWVILEIVTVVADGLLSFRLSAGVVGIAVAFSMAIGILFGIYPANKAAKKHPIQALRYEG